MASLDSRLSPYTNWRTNVAYSQNRARMESSLARAHRAIVDAKHAADAAGDPGAYLDLQQIEVEITRVAEGSLNRTRKRQLRGQTSIATGA